MSRKLLHIGTLKEVHVTGELEAKLTHSAARQGRNPDDLVQDVLTSYFEEEARFIEAVKHGEDALQGGQYSLMNKSASVSSGFYNPDASPLVVARGGRFGAHLRTYRARQPGSRPACWREPSMTVAPG